MSDTKLSVYPGFTAGWCLPSAHSINVSPANTAVSGVPITTATTVDPASFNYLEWSQPPEQELDLSSLITETDCPVCQHPPTLLNEAQDRCERDGRLTCYRCGWKGPV